MMVHCNESETSASNSVHAVHIQTRFIPEDGDINYDDRGDVSKKLIKSAHE